MRSRSLCALVLALCLLAGLTAPAAGAGGLVILETPEDLMTFSRNCTLDSWSRGRTARLMADIDLSGRDFAPIPTFGGTFEGNGHTISGLCLTAPGSRQGLFRTVQAEGVVKDLRVEGTVAPGGSREMVGGVVGVNHGTIQDCAFSGSVEGSVAVGGVAGVNEATGQLLRCETQGTVLGQQRVGGICGRNLGSLIQCENAAGVDLREGESAQGVQDLDLADALEQFVSGDRDAVPAAEGYSDVGGIVGFTSGVVQSCVNRGGVGRPHVGYNVGGVAGRQTGYLSDCVNRGLVRGRKDVGGIVGQAEPEVSVSLDGDALARLREELERLNGMIHTALGDVDAQSAAISQRLEAMGDGVDEAAGHSQTLLEGVETMVDGNVASINLLSANLTGALDVAGDSMADFTAATDALTVFARDLSGAMESLSAAGEDGARLAGELGPIAGDLATAAGDMKTAADRVSGAIEHLQAGVVVNDQDVCDKALLDLSSATASLGTATRRLAKALRDMENAFLVADFTPTGNLVGDLKDWWDSLGPMFTALGDLGDGLDGLGRNMEVIGLALWNLQDETEIYPDEFTAAVDELQLAISGGGAAAAALGTALEKLRAAAGDIATLSTDLSNGMSALGDAARDASQAGESLSRGFEGLEKAIGRLTDGGAVEFVPLGEDVRNATDDLYQALGTVSREMDALNGELAGATTALTADMGAIADQFNLVLTLLLDTLYDVRTGSGDIVRFEDVSDQELDAIRQGKTADSENYAPVEGDRNVGGVVGAMAIEYDLDPEDESAGRLTYYATYETRAVVQDCVSYGDVTAKKNCAGGVAGRMDLGTVFGSRAYGTVKSTGGSYVGGVAGSAASTVRSCFARVRLWGEDYVGGIAGKGTVLRDCRAAATLLRGREYVGAVAGWAPVDEGTVTGNLFLESGLGAVDSVSYEGAAQSATYRELSALEGLPRDFLTFTLTLVCGDAVMATYPIEYGEDLTRRELPEPMEREGCYGRWSPAPTSAEGDVVLEAVYTPWVTLLPSLETEGPLALVIADGQFTRHAILRAQPGDLTPPGSGESRRVMWVTLENADVPTGETVPVRVLAGEDETVWLRGEKGWEKADGRQNGRYFLTQLPASGAAVAVTTRTSAGYLPWVLAAAGALALGAVLWLVRRARRRKQETPPAEPSETGPAAPAEKR